MATYILIMVFLYPDRATGIITSITHEYSTEASCIKATNALHKQFTRSGAVLAVQCTQK